LHGHYVSLVDFDSAMNTFILKDDQRQNVIHLSFEDWSNNRKKHGIPVMLNYFDPVVHETVTHSDLSGNLETIVSFLHNETICDPTLALHGSDIRANLISGVQLNDQQLQCFLPISLDPSQSIEKVISSNKKLLSVALLNAVCVLKSWGINLMREQSTTGFGIKGTVQVGGCLAQIQHIMAYSESIGNHLFSGVIKQIMEKGMSLTGNEGNGPAQLATEIGAAHTDTGGSNNPGREQGQRALLFEQVGDMQGVQEVGIRDDPMAPVAETLAEPADCHMIPENQDCSMLLSLDDQPDIDGSFIQSNAFSPMPEDTSWHGEEDLQYLVETTILSLHLDCLPLINLY